MAVYALTFAEHHPLKPQLQLVKNMLDAGRDWGQEKGTTEDEMAGWHYRLDGHEFE